MKTEKGFTLIEVLVTLVIMSFGLLGIAGIIMTSFKNNQSSYSRTQATLLANDIIESMRANRVTAETNPSPYNLALGASPTGAGVPTTNLTQWRAELAGVLPSGTGSVAVNAVTRKVTVVVQWNDSRASAGTTGGQSVVLANQSITVESRL